MGKQKEEEEKKDRTALLLQERKKIMYNLVLLGAASFVVLIAVLTMAWFVNNTKVDAPGMSVTIETQQGLKVSLGKKNNNYLLDGITAPGEDEVDWMSQVAIRDFYTFGKLIPASSSDGNHILFTPDSVKNGRFLANSYHFYVADGKTDGDLKNYLNALSVKRCVVRGNLNDSNPLMTTAHPKSAANDSWSGVRSSAWYDTNDDGYFVDIPIWFRTNATSGLSYNDGEYVLLKVEGYVEPGRNKNDGDTLYQAVRVAILKEDKTPAIVNSIISLKDSSYSGSSIMDSRNYTDYRNTDPSSSILPDDLYGRHIDNLVTWMADVEDEGEGESIEPANTSYIKYTCYNGSDPIVQLALPSANASWGGASKIYLRIWLDGEDEQCYNATAGQDWTIHLKFSTIDSLD